MQAVANRWPKRDGLPFLMKLGLRSGNSAKRCQNSRSFLSSHPCTTTFYLLPSSPLAPSRPLTSHHFYSLSFPKSADSQVQSSVATAGAQFDFEEGSFEDVGVANDGEETIEHSVAADGGATNDLLGGEESDAGGGNAPEPLAIETLKNEVVDQLYYGLEDPSMAAAAAAASAVAVAAAAAVSAVPCDFPLAAIKGGDGGGGGGGAVTTEGPLSLCMKSSVPSEAEVANGGVLREDQKLWCHTCDISFTEPLPFELHVQSHEMDKKCMKCFHCGKTFASYSNLKRHKKIHTGVRPHVCTFCTRPFLNRSDLVRHWRIHTGERPYRCEVCQHAFKYSFNLKTHQQKYHNHA